MVEKPLTIEWSLAALADLDRFAAFLHQHDPRLAASVARSIIEKTKLLAENPNLGRVMISGGRNRRLMVHVLNTFYELRYRDEGHRVVVLRVFHGREDRGR